MILTLQEYKDYAKISVTELDEILTELATETESIVTNYLGRDLDAEDYAEYYSGTGTNTLVLNHYPINSLTSITEYSGSDTETIVLSDYTYRILDYKILFEDYVFKYGTGNYKIEYNAGWSVLPSDLKLALKRLFTVLLNESPYKNNTLGMSSFIKQNERIYLDGKAQEKILNSISHYKVYNI